VEKRDPPETHKYGAHKVMKGGGGVQERRDRGEGKERGGGGGVGTSKEKKCTGKKLGPRICLGGKHQLERSYMKRSVHSGFMKMETHRRGQLKGEPARRSGERGPNKGVTTYKETCKKGDHQRQNSEKI